MSIFSGVWCGLVDGLGDPRSLRNDEPLEGEVGVVDRKVDERCWSVLVHGSICSAPPVPWTPCRQVKQCGILDVRGWGSEWSACDDGDGSNMTGMSPLERHDRKWRVAYGCRCRVYLLISLERPSGKHAGEASPVCLDIFVSASLLGVGHCVPVGLGGVWSCSRCRGVRKRGSVVTAMCLRDGVCERIGIVVECPHNFPNCAIGARHGFYGEGQHELGVGGKARGAPPHPQRSEQCWTGWEHQWYLVPFTKTCSMEGHHGEAQHGGGKSWRGRNRTVSFALPETRQMTLMTDLPPKCQT